MTGSRFRLRVPASSEGHVDGAWWPQSRDLVAELLPLLDELRVGGNPVGRVIYGRDFWRVNTRRIRVGDRIASLGGFSKRGAELVRFIDNTGSRRRLDVLVVEPGGDPTFAVRVLDLACTAGNPLRADEILVHAQSVGSSA